MNEDASRRQVLIVTTAFTPLNPRDAQRIRLSLPYYRQNGWDVVVLTVSPAVQTEPADESLLGTLPTDLRLVRCGAFPLKLSRRLGIGTLGLRSWAHLFVAGTRLLRSERFDLIFFSTAQFPTLSLGPIWSKVFKIPYVVDLQSPRHLALDKTKAPGKAPARWKHRWVRSCAIFLDFGAGCSRCR